MTNSSHDIYVSVLFWPGWIKNTGVRYIGVIIWNASLKDGINFDFSDALFKEILKAYVTYGHCNKALGKYFLISTTLNIYVSISFLHLPPMVCHFSVMYMTW